MVDNRYYTVQQAAEILSVDEEQILGWIRSGQLRAVNVAADPRGKRPRWRIAESELGRLLLSRVNPAAMAAPKPAPVAKRTKPRKQHV